MTDTPEADSAPEAAEAAPAKSSKRKLILLAIPVLLLLLGAGGWFSGIIPRMLGHDAEAERTEEAAKAETPTFVDVPELVANLNSAGKRAAYVKVTVRIEVAGTSEAEKVKAAMPRVQDVIQTYLREMRPEELRGSAGIYRLREELLTRANVAVAPAKINDILFTQMLVQ